MSDSKTFQILAAVAAFGNSPSAHDRIVEIIVTADAVEADMMDASAVVHAIYPNTNVFSAKKKEIK